MISVLTVEVSGCQPHLEIFKESIANKSKLVSEVIIAVVDATVPIDETWEVGKIKYKRFSHPVDAMWYGHGLGLNAALKHASKEYVIFSDPDVFWYTAVDEFYLDMMQTHGLNCVGVSHHNGVNQCYKYFPCVMNCMVKKSTLPDRNWLLGNLKFRNSALHRTQLLENDDYPMADGEFLIPNPIPGLCDTYPNKDPHAIFDVGCNLWLWNEEIKGKWIAFQTADCHIYTTSFYRNNFGFKNRFKKERLIYHLSSSARNNIEELNCFKKAYIDQ